MGHLYRNRRDGTFEDVTAKSGIVQTGWGQAACSGDYDNDGADDLFVTVVGTEPSLPQPGRRHVRRRDRSAPGSRRRRRAGARAAPSSTTTATAGSISSPRTTSISTSPPRRCPESGLCRYKGHSGRVRPARTHRRQERPLPKRRQWHVRGRLRSIGHHARQRHLRPRRQHARFQRRRVGRFVRGERLEPERAVREQQGRHVQGRRRRSRLRLQPGRQAAGGHGRRRRRLRPQRHSRPLQDQLRGRHLDAVRERRQGLLRGSDLRRLASGSTPAGSDGASPSSISTTTAGWTSSSSTATSIRRSNGSRRKPATNNGRSSIATSETDASRMSSERLGPPVTTPAAGRGAAFADLDNDGDIDVVVNNVHAAPDLFRLDAPPDAHWLTLKLVGTRSNRSAIGARVRLVACGRRAGPGGPRRRQLLLAERPAARISGSVEIDDDRARGGALAERARGAVDRARCPMQIVTLTEGSGTAMPPGQVMRRAGTSTDRVVPRCGSSASGS